MEKQKSEGLVGKRPTLADIAAMANVDVSTVSRSLSNSPRVTRETRERVQQIAHSLGYVANQRGRLLRAERAGQVLVMLPSIASNFFPDVVLGMEDELRPHGINVLLGNTGYDKNIESDLGRELLSGMVDGLLLLTGNVPEPLQNLAGFERKLVAVSRPTSAHGVPWVSIDNVAATKELMHHLFESGHTAIAHISGPTESQIFAARADTYRSMMRNAGLQRHIRVVEMSQYDSAAGAAAARQLLREGRLKFTALMCASDEMAFGAIRQLSTQGLSVPDEISVSGFDDIDLSHVYIPSLTTVRLPRRQMGRLGARMLLQNMNPECDAPENCILQHKLVVRESTSVVRT